MNSSITQSWSHAVKRRYYRVHIAPDLFGDLCMVRSWGSLDTARGNSKMELLQNWQIAEQRLNQIAKERWRRGYVQMEFIETDAGGWHFPAPSLPANLKLSKTQEALTWVL